MKLLDKQKWFLPTLAIRMIDNLIIKGGETEESIKTKRSFSKTREAWVTAIFLLDKILAEKRLWYLKGNENEYSVDDMYARSLWLKNGVYYSDKILPIQVVRKTEYKKEEIIHIIKKKLIDDLRGVSLVCHIMTDEEINWQSLSEEVHKLNPQLNDITLIGKVEKRKFIVGRIYPDIYTSVIDIETIKIDAPDIIEATEVNRAEATGMTKYGTAILTPILTPILKIE